MKRLKWKSFPSRCLFHFHSWFYEFSKFSQAWNKTLLLLNVKCFCFYLIERSMLTRWFMLHGFTWNLLQKNVYFQHLPQQCFLINIALVVAHDAINFPVSFFFCEYFISMQCYPIFIFPAFSGCLIFYNIHFFTSVVGSFECFCIMIFPKLCS